MYGNIHECESVFKLKGVCDHSIPQAAQNMMEIVRLLGRKRSY